MIIVSMASLNSKLEKKTKRHEIVRRPVVWAALSTRSQSMATPYELAFQ